MSKKKNKRIPKAKLQEQERQKHYQNFVDRIKYYCMVVGGDDAFDILPERVLEIMYLVRCMPCRIVEAPGCNVPHDEMKTIRKEMIYLLRDEPVKLTKAGPEITLYEFLSLGLTIIFYLDSLKEDDFLRNILEKRLAPLFDTKEEIAFAAERYMDLLKFVSLTYSRLDSRLYWLTFSLDLSKTNDSKFENLILVNSYIAEEANFTIDNLNRPALRVSWVFSDGEISYAELNPYKAGLSQDPVAPVLKVYIQHHALKRLTERIDCLDVEFLHMHLVVNFKDPLITVLQNGNLLIEYQLFQIKAGYLVGEIADDNLVIKTFLFVTNNGTPEGKKLLEIYHLGKIDKSYLAIDKLSTFMTSDIGENEPLGVLLKSCGCECLLELYKCMGHISTKSTSRSTIDYINRYIGTGLKTGLPGMWSLRSRKTKHPAEPW